MDFFAAQDRARRKTWQLVALFVIAVIALIVTTNLLIAVVAAYTTTTGAVMGPGGALASQSAGTWLLISGIVIIVIAGASLSKYFTLRSGGRAIVELLDGRQLDPGAQSPAERRLLNVVEEMSIAAGIPVPAVYLIDEPGINAFAAGFSSDDAVIGVTRGALEFLNRDELQGVIGHEFSHVLNGDSRINLRLIAILNGIVFLGVIGRLLLRSSSTGSSRRNSSGMPVLAMGLGLVVIGAAGTFCGNLIKAAVSRQREFLADAAAVQFTRNPGGIANALKKIGGVPQGSAITNAHAVEMSHMFFGQAIRMLFGGMMATHPPLAERIRAIEPGWDGEFPSGAAIAPVPADSDLVSAFAGPGVPRENIASAVGNPTAASLAQAHTLIEGLPERAVAAAHDAWSARALLYALLLAEDPTVRDRQYAVLAQANPREMVNAVDALRAIGPTLDALQRLTLTSLALPALKTLSHAQYATFVADLVTLIRSDQRIDLFEWVLHRVLLKALKPHFEGPTRVAARYPDLRAVLPQVTEVLSAIARADTADADAQRRAFTAGAAAVEIDLVFAAASDPNFTRLNDALRQLRLLSPLAKPRLLKACAACALIDGTSPTQRALLIGIAATLDCPLPPDPASVHF
jgi:Zn-dependent protease with chaperone function